MLDRIKSSMKSVERAPAFARDLAALALLALVSWIDFLSPPYVFLTGFYFLQVGFAVWFARRPVLIFTTAVALALSLSMTSQLIPAGEAWTYPAMAYFSVLLEYLGFTVLMIKLKSSFDRLVDESRTDALTGLQSRRAFVHTVEFERSRATRSGECLALALLDLDNFKQINDTQGHAAGDALLVAASRCMVAALREIDVVGRLGGDEFAILLPGATSETAGAVLERVRLRLKDLLRTFSPQVTASIGAAILPPGTHTTVAELLHAADLAMYSVKHESKDGLVIRSLAELSDGGSVLPIRAN